MKSTRILLIDDDEMSNFISEKTIQKAAIVSENYSYTNAREALSYLEKLGISEPDNLPDIIFLDINMPEMNGWEFLEAFRKIKGQIAKDITVIILTSSVYVNDQEQAKKYPEVKDYVSKPLNVSVLKELQEKYLLKEN